MKVIIDYDRCSGQGRCYEVSPEVFVDDESGYGQVRDPELATPEQEAAARRAVASCPEQAISIVE